MGEGVGPALTDFVKLNKAELNTVGRAADSVR